MFVCDECNTQFVDLTTAKEHLRSHADVSDAHLSVTLLDKDGSELDLPPAKCVHFSFNLSMKILLQTHASFLLRTLQPLTPAPEPPASCDVNTEPAVTSVKKRKFRSAAAIEREKREKEKLAGSKCL